MAYSVPLTAVSNSTLTAAQWNASMRDNMLVTPAALATTAGRWFVTTGLNAIAERAIESDTVNTVQTTTSTAYADLATVGPSVTVTTGTKALVFFEAQMYCSLSNTSVRCAVQVSGATSIGASDNEDLYIDGLPANNQIRAAAFSVFTGLTAGSNTFTLKYKTGGGTGGFADRKILVMAL